MYFHLSYLIAQTTTNQAWAITPPFFWLISGTILCIIEFLLPKKAANKIRLIALSLGICAIILSFILWQLSVRMGFFWYYIMFEDFDVQILYWMGLSLTTVIWIRPAFTRRKKFVIPDALEARTISEILPGQTGRVLYEGGSWKARCEGYQGSIAIDQIVYVLRREGNTLIIAPDKLFQL